MLKKIDPEDISGGHDESDEISETSNKDASTGRSVASLERAPKPNTQSKTQHRSFEKVEDQIQAINEQWELMQWLQEENKRLKDEVRGLLIRQDDMEQSLKLNTLEIIGVPVSTSEPPEPLTKTIVKIGSALGVALTEEGIDECHRWGESGITVTFSRRRDADQLLEARAARKNFSTKDLEAEGETKDKTKDETKDKAGKRIFVRVALTPRRMVLFQKSLKLKKDFHYLSVWVDRYGRVKAVKNKDSRIIRIADEEELTELIKTEISTGWEK